ncbi:MAG: hypothetical protein RLZZ385_2787 [Pseudomonadota bacterium]|jgi:acetylornithine/N-succinyldiaminopimelate aminotransferase
MNVIDVEDQMGITFSERLPLVVEYGKGSHVWDDKGARYLDFTSGWGVTCLGHAHPVITDAITRQASRIIQNPNSGFTYAPPRAELLRQLNHVLPAGLRHAYFCNSGAEANDAAIKLARKVTGRINVVSTLGSFHGRTFNTLSVSGGRHNTSRYLPILQGTCFVAHDDIDAMSSVIDQDTAAVIVEPVQGEGGVRIARPGYLSELQALCRANGALLIVDEVQTGFCRTGRFFACGYEEESFSPDIMTMAKGIAGGLPMAAFAVSAKVNSAIQKGDHGGTFSGNPLACAVATAVVDYLRVENVADRVQRSGTRLLAGLRDLQAAHAQHISAVRGIGLLTAMDVGSDQIAWDITRACLSSGLLVTPTRNGIIRLLPSLLVEDLEIDSALNILSGVLQARSSDCGTGNATAGRSRDSRAAAASAVAAAS